MTAVLDLLVAAGARIRGIEEAAAAGDVSGWLTAETPLEARIRALVMAADHERLGVIDELLAAGTPIDATDAVWGRQACASRARTTARRASPTCSRAGAAARRRVPVRLASREPGRFQPPCHSTREAALPSDTLTIVDNRTGPRVLAADRRRCDPRHRPRPDQRGRGRRRTAVVRPGVPEHVVVPQRDHVHRRRRRDPALPRLPDRAGRRAGELPRDRVPAARGRAADRRAARRRGRRTSASTPTCTRTSRSSSRASATTRTRWGRCSARSARSRRSTRTRRTSPIRRTATSSASG